MLNKPTTVSNAIFFAVLLGIVTPGLAAPPEGKGGGKDRGGDPVISVEWRRDVWQAPEIRTMDELGDNMVTVTSDPDLKRGGWPRWSPDGLRLGGYHKYIGDAGDYGLMSIAADGTDEQLIVLSSELGQFSLNRGLSAEYSDLGLAAWSPDGQSMVFSGRVTYPKELFDPQPAYDVLVLRLFTASAGFIIPVTEVPDATTVSGTDPTSIQYGDWHPHWSSSLNRIIFVSSRSGSLELWAIDPHGTNLQQLTDFGSARLYEPVWSHVGDRIAVRVNLEAAPSSSGDIWVLRVDNGLPVTITSPSIVIVRNDPLMLEGAPAWSPLDDQLVFARSGAHNSRTRRYEIVIVDLSTDSETVIAGSKKQAILWPDWNPASPVP